MKCKCGIELPKHRTICYACELEQKIAEDRLARETMENRSAKIQAVKNKLTERK